MTILREELTSPVYGASPPAIEDNGRRPHGLLAYNQHMRAFLTLAAGALAIGFWVYAVVDCALTDSRRARGIPKGAWVLVIVVLNIIGGALWFIVGKDRSQGRGGSRVDLAPDDNPTFLHSIAADAEQEERIRQLEKEIADLDDDSRDQ
ncbi:MAG: PLD nuclease N-terminal domain-containing protein [Terrimesophilobacter sp.]